MGTPTIGVVIPCFRVKRHILAVLSGIGDEVSRIYVVDDSCPEETGNYVSENCLDPRVVVIQNLRNLGVGGAVINGYLAAERDSIDIIVKLDGDGQMDAKKIPYLVEPIINGEADYTKGNRFVDLDQLLVMPKLRIFGNAVLSFMSKFSTGYWDIFDPTNGFTALRMVTLRTLPLKKINARYFFESDMLFRLNLSRAVVVDRPIAANYGDEVSNLNILKVILPFIYYHLVNACKRIIYNYFIRDFAIASLELVLGVFLFSFGIFFGAFNWFSALGSITATPTGTIVLSALCILMGLQLILAFISYDIFRVPRTINNKKFEN